MECFAEGEGWNVFPRKPGLGYPQVVDLLREIGSRDQRLRACIVREALVAIRRCVPDVADFASRAARANVEAEPRVLGENLWMGWG